MLESLSSAAFDDSLAPGAGHVALAIPPTDGERLMRFQRYRDEAAFAQVVETHAKMVWGVCSQILRHQQDVEDAFQATFLILARKAGAIRAAEAPPAGSTASRFERRCSALPSLPSERAAARR